jgi:hypothetical protein
MSTMSTDSANTRSTTPTGGASRPVVRHARRLSTETKSAFKTTEFLAYIGTVIAIAIAAQTIGKDSGAANGADYFRADRAFLYIVIVTVGYLLSRGLAKSGSRDFYDDSDHDH